MKIEPYSEKRMLYCDDKCSLYYYRGKLIYKDVHSEQTTNIGGKYSRFSFVERLMRKEPRCAARVDENHIIVSFDGNIYAYCISDNSVIIEHRFNKGMNNPLEFLKVKDKQTFESIIYYGEYIWNTERGPVSIYRRKTGKWEKVYTFPEKTITHIHNIIWDKYRDGFIILTGDDDSESGIWFADCDLKSIHPILLGSQQYRACVAFPDIRGFYYATDTPLEDNYLYYVELNQRLEVEDVKKIYNMPGPCIYGTMHESNIFMSTSVEPDSSLNKWRYRFTYRLGRGVQDRFSHIIKITPEGKIEDICKFKKDILPIWLFQFGNVLFPKNEGKIFYAVLQSIAKSHGKTIKIDN